MSQQSKLRQSRQPWKHQAKARADHNRSLRNARERLRNARERATQALKKANKQLRHKEAPPTHLQAHRGWWTLTFCARAHLSFRAVARVRHGLADWLGIGKAPCPQTIINGVMRLSVGRLQSVKLCQGAARHLRPFTNGLIWMIATRITLGTGTLRRVLALDAHHDQLAGCAPGFQHGRGIAGAGSPAWTGERLAALLERVIAGVGRPAASLKDGGSALQTATAVLSERGVGRPVIDDISHAVANMLKRRDETHPPFSTFLSACGQASGRLKHTVLAGLTPPKVQTQSRFMHVHRLVRWADRVLGLWPAGRAKAGAVLAKLRTCLDDLPPCRTLIRQLRDEAVALLACQKRRKPHGLTHDPLPQCEPLLDTMASGRVRQACARDLHQQCETATSLGLAKVGVPLSADPIASLFGLPKQHGAGPIKDANRMALRIPALCSVPTLEEAGQVLEITVAPHQALTDGVASLTTPRRQRRAEPLHLEQLGSGRDQGNVEIIPPGKDRSDRSNILYLPHGYKEVKESLPQRHEVSPTQATVVGTQVQNPGKDRTPI